MPDFEIGFTEDCWEDEGIPYGKVRLNLQGPPEFEHDDLTFWSPQDYENQWLTELRQITTGRNSGALIVSIHDPSVAYRIWIWSMWKRDETILFHNQLLFMLEQGDGFSPVHISDFIGPYSSHNENGDLISEWAVPVTAIQDFLETTKVYAN